MGFSSFPKGLKYNSPKAWTWWGNGGRGTTGTKQSRSLLKVIMASIAIVYFLQNQRTSIKITCFFDILRKFDIHLSSNCNRSIYFEIFAIVFIAFFFIWLWKIFFLIGNYLFILLFYINCSPLLFLCRLNSSFLISTISFFFPQNVNVVKTQ